MTIETLSFNTGRLYSDNGQRITAATDGETILFIDHDRMISGIFPAMCAPFDEVGVMLAYDGNAFVSSDNFADGAVVDLQNAAQSAL